VAWLALAAPRWLYLRPGELSLRTVTAPRSPSIGATKRRRDTTTQELRHAVEQHNAANKKQAGTMTLQQPWRRQTPVPALCGLTPELSRPATYESVSCGNWTPTHLNQVTKRVRLERIVRQRLSRCQWSSPGSRLQHHDNRTCAAANSHQEQSRRRNLQALEPRSAGATQLHKNPARPRSNTMLRTKKPAEAVERQQRGCRQTFAPLWAA